MSDPQLSVVVASVNGFPYLGACLDSLRDHCPRAQVIVADCTDAATRQLVRDGWPFVTLLAFDEPTSVPALRAAGIFEATSSCIAVIEDHCVILDGWQAALLAAQEAGHRVVGGPIRNGQHARLRDCSAFLFEYSAFIEPMERGLATDLPGMNVCYDRDAVEAIEDPLREGRWEAWLHRRLRERGFELFCEPNAVIEHDMDFGVRGFVAQRFHYSRAHADMRNAELGWRRVVYFLGSPLLIPLLYWRVARNVFRKRHYRTEFVLASPLLLFYVAVSAGGEAVGYAFGGGRSLLRVR